MSDFSPIPVTVIGGGLAGSECALQLASRGVPVTLYEQRPVSSTPAHHTGSMAELVCSNSLKTLRPDSAAGMLKEELADMGSFLLQAAKDTAVPAGGALAVDREEFSAAVDEMVNGHPLITVVHEEVTEIPEGPVVIAAGPLCSEPLFEALSEKLGEESLHFFDAAAPIVDAESIDYDKVFAQSRWSDGEEGADYLNCPMDKDTYDSFMEELLGADRVVLHDFERSELFQACQPVEEVAKTGHDALRFGALKPVGLTDPATGHRPWAAVQLRRENREGTAYNLVGFQTNLTFGEQRRVFSMIPGLENATFFRYGVMHRNSFVDSPRVLDGTFAIPGTQIRLAGQICGTEGYTEAIASGLLAALNTYADLTGEERVALPRESALGSLVAYATDPETSPYQPMHVNFGLVPPLEKKLKKKARYEAYAKRGREAFRTWQATRPELFPSLACPVVDAAAQADMPHEDDGADRGEPRQ